MGPYLNFKARLALSVCVLGIAFLIAVCPLPSRAEEQFVSVWSYYGFPPFITSKNQGLSHDLVELLNERGQGRFRFELRLLPRKRIDLLLSDSVTGIVLFVNPSWMGLRNLQKYEWTPSLFSDRNVIVSNVARKVDFTGPESLAGLTLGGILGRKYEALDELVDAGLIKREDATSEQSNLLKLCEKRIDFTTGPETMLRPLVESLCIEKHIYFSPTPLFQYTRHILISDASPALSEFIVQFVRGLPTNPKWIAIKDKYKLRD
jgi:polar amino acid transport system substrate-binding protein